MKRSRRTEKRTAQNKTDGLETTHELIKKRNTFIRDRILVAIGGSAYLTFSVFAISLIVTDFVESIKSGEPGSLFSAHSLNRMIELTSHWIIEIRKSDLGVSEVMNIAAISAALVLAVSLRSRNAQDGTVDEESRFIWLRRFTIIFCLWGAAICWGLAIAQNWLAPEEFAEGLIIILLASTVAGLAAVVGDSIYSLSRAQRKALLRKSHITKEALTIIESATRSPMSNRDSLLAWWILGFLLPVVTTLIAAYWGIDRRQGNVLGIIPPAIFITAWCLYIWLYRSRVFDLTSGLRRYLTLHIFVGFMLILQGFYTFTLATWSLYAGIAVVAFTYTLPWLVLADIDRQYPIFKEARLKTMKKETARLNGDIQKIQQSIDAYGSTSKSPNDL